MATGLDWDHWQDWDHWAGASISLVTSGRRRPASGGKFHGNWQNFCSFSLDIDRESLFSLLFHTFDSSKYKLDGVKDNSRFMFSFPSGFVCNFLTNNANFIGFNVNIL